MTVSDLAKRSPTRDEVGAALAALAAAPGSAEEIAVRLSELVDMLRDSAWLDGELRIEVAREGMGASVNLYVEQGAVRERALPAAVFAIPLDELDVALQASQLLFAPMRMRHHKGKVIFNRSGVAGTIPPPEIVVAPDSLASSVENPHEKVTAKQPAFVLPDALESGKRLRRTPEGG